MPLVFGIGEAEFVFATTSLFIFAIVFGLLSVSGLFERRINGVIAVVFGLISAAYTPFSAGLKTYLPFASVVLVVVFIVVFINKIFEPKGKEKKFDSLPIAVSLAIGIFVFATQFTKLGIYVPGITTEDVMWTAILAIIIMIFVAVYYHKPLYETRETR